jgi:hypothetical protein
VLVSEWFVSAGRLDHWAYRSSPRRWQCRARRRLQRAPRPGLYHDIQKPDRTLPLALYLLVIAVAAIYAT